MLKHPPSLGGPAREGMLVIEVLSQKLMGLVEFRGKAYLDVGVGVAPLRSVWGTISTGWLE